MTTPDDHYEQVRLRHLIRQQEPWQARAERIDRRLADMARMLGHRDALDVLDAATAIVDAEYNRLGDQGQL